MKNNVKLIYLFSGLLFLLFSNGRFTIALATWIAPILLLNYTRKSRPFTGYFVLAITMGVVNQVSFWRFSSQNPFNIIFYLPFFMGFILTMPYLTDRLLLNNFSGIVRTLIFPITYTTVEFIYTSVSPLGSTGNLAYTQTDFTSLIQIASITGIYGIAFLITWFSSVTSFAICSENIKALKKEIVVCLSVLILVITFGGLRLLIPEAANTVRVSGLHVYDLRSDFVQDTWDNVQTDPDSFRKMCDKILNDLITATKAEASAGSKIVVWSEISPLMLYQDQNKYIDTIITTAKENNIIIVASPYILSEDLKGKDTNKLLIINSDGKILLEHFKFGGAALDNIVEGDKKLQSVATPFGKLSGVVCWDADFPAIVSQEGVLGTDILLSPAADWKAIDPIHSAPAYFRGIECGMSVLRQTVNGLSFASDTKGRFLARVDHYTSSEWVTVAQLPIKKSFTLYPIIGDTFAILNCVAFIFFVGLSFRRYAVFGKM